MSATLTIGGNAVIMIEDQFDLTNNVDERQRFKCDCIDYTGILHFTKGMRVILSDPILNAVYTGFLNSDREQIQYPSGAIQHSIDCVDWHYVADKRTFTATFADTLPAGVLATKQAHDVLIAEGLNQNFAVRIDSTQTDWNQGTNSGTIGALKGDGDLELAPAGSNVIISETISSGLSSGTLTGVSVGGTGLTPTLTQAIQLSVTGTGSVYTVAWTGSQVIGTSDTLNFTTWNDPHVGVGSLSFVCSDGTDYRQNVGSDTTTNPGTGWWTRAITLPSFWNGKTITQLEIVFSFTGTAGTVYTTYFKNIYLSSASGSPFFSTTQTTYTGVSAPYAVILSGFTAANATILPTWDPYATSTRLSPAYSVAAAGILSFAYLSYFAILPANTALVVTCSTDGGATWQTCTNNANIPQYLAGMNLSGQTIQFLETLSGTDPTAWPVLNSLTCTVYSAPAITKTDIEYTAHLAADWNAGTLTNVSVVNNALTIPGVTSFSSQNTFDNGGGNINNVNYNTLGPSSVVVTWNGGLSSSTAYHTHIQLLSPGTYSAFTVNIILSAGINSGVYPNASRTSGVTYLNPQWNNTAGTFGYCVQATATWDGTNQHTFISLLRGSAGGGITTLQAPFEVTGTAFIIPLSVSSCAITVTYSGGVHTVYGNNIKMFSVTDSTFTSASNIGVYMTWNGGSTPTSGSSVTNSFSVTPNPATGGTWVSPGTSLSSIGTCGSSLILWTATTQSVLTNLTLETSLDNGSTWSFATSGAAIPSLPAGTNMSGKTLKIRATLLSAVISNIATLSALRVQILGQYSASGTRTTIPLGNDTMIRANVGSGFGTGFDGQTYTQVGTGTTALTSNEATIINTTGDVHMQYGTSTWFDEDGTCRFALSASTINAGVELRYTDVNNYYRFSASSSTLTLLKRSGGILQTFVTQAMVLSTGVYYRMRFRCVNAGPVLLYGKVWQDGTLEPINWSINASD